MGKEFAGGTHSLETQRVPVEFVDDRALPVAFTMPEVDHLDGLEEQAMQALKDGTFDAWLANYSRRAVREEVGRFFLKMCSVLLHSPSKERAVLEMTFASGLHLLEGVSGSQIARNLGIRKQAFYQGVERMAETLRGIRFIVLRLNQRDAAARDNMRRSNYRSAPPP